MQRLENARFSTVSEHAFATKEEEEKEEVARVRTKKLSRGVEGGVPHSALVRAQRLRAIPVVVVVGPHANCVVVAT